MKIYSWKMRGLLATMLALRSKGMAMRKIAKQLNISPTTVQKWLKAANTKAQNYKNHC